MNEREATGGAGEVFLAFLKLGLTSFGGPIAHLGYFRDAFVTRRKWLSEAEYADLVALCQFLPGPASSQAGFLIGFARAGWPGAMAAFLGFTLPSVLALVMLALAAGSLSGPLAEGVIHGLKLVSVAVVAHAVLGMARSLAPDATRATIAVAAVAILALMPVSIGMGLAILCGAAAGLVLCRGQGGAGAAPILPRVSPVLALVALVLFFLLLLGLPLLNGGTASFLSAFIQAGALVFGGGHVVLPLLEAGTVAPGWISAGDFLAGYGLTQAMPGPLFTFAAWIGVLSSEGPGGFPGALLATVAIFLPGFLILIAALPFWARLQALPRARAAMAGANAAVVGILAAALWSPVMSGAILAPLDLAIAGLGFVLLAVWRLPPLVVVLVLTALGPLAA